VTVNLNTLPHLGDPFIENKAAESIVPQEQTLGADENVKAVPSPADQEQTPLATLADKTASEQEQTT
jgi:hypothetical protein